MMQVGEQPGQDDANSLQISSLNKKELVLLFPVAFFFAALQ